MRDSIFVSYSRTDRQALDELRQHLGATLDAVRVTLWDDTRISPAARWQGEIEEGLSTAAAAVLLLSPAFFASDFIANHELPVLLEAAARSELRIFPVVAATCDHGRVTAVYQAVNDPARPLDRLDAAERRTVWARLGTALQAVAAEIGDEARIAAERARLENDVVAVPAVAAVDDKMRRAGADPAFDGYETMRENTLVFLQGQRCQAVSGWLLEESKREDQSPFRRQAIVRMMKDVAAVNERALQRATELTQQFADEALAMLKEAKQQTPPRS